MGDVRVTEMIRWLRAAEMDVQYSDADKKKMVLRAVPLDVLNVPTDNGTLYTASNMRAGMKKLKSLVERGQGYIFVDHPVDDPAKEPVPNEYNQFSRAGLRITELQFNDSAPDDGEVRILADINVLDTASGRDIKACLEDGGAIGFSKRGLVSKWNERVTQKFGKVREADQYYLEGYDCVIGQAVRSAEVRDYVMEQDKRSNTMEVKDIKSLEDLKQLPAAVFENVLTVAKEAVRTEVATESAKTVEKDVTAKIDAAVKPLNDRIAALESSNNQYKVGLESVVLALSEAGLIETREPEDAEKELRQQVETLTKERDDLKKKATEAVTPDPVPEIDGEGRAKEQLEESGWKAAVVESMRGSKFASEPEFKRALEQACGVAKRVFEAGKGLVQDPNAQAAAPDDEKAKRAKEMERLIGM